METYDPNKNTTEVRQGNRRTMNLRVLIIATIVVVAVFAVLFTIFATGPDGTVLQSQ
jgi:hypothetical protein